MLVLLYKVYNGDSNTQVPNLMMQVCIYILNTLFVILKSSLTLPLSLKIWKHTIKVSRKQFEWAIPIPL